MDIIKKSNGQVWLVQSGNLEKILPATAIVEVKSEREIIVKQGMNQFTSIFVSEIDNYQIEPASPIAFSGNVYDLMLILSDFFFELSGGGGGGDDLATVLANGNDTGANNIDVNTNYAIRFDNGSNLKQGTTDGGLGGNKGIAQVCSLDYQLKWEAGRLYVMQQDGFTIRSVLYQFAITPTTTDDNTKGFVVGSRWMLDNGRVYICTDATTSAAVWILETISGYVPYTGATSDLDMGTHNITSDHMLLNTSPSGLLAVGGTRWNNALGSSETLLKGGSVLLKNGVDLVARVVNKVTPNQTLTKAGYKAVRVSGAQGQRLAVELAQGNNDANSADTLGLVCETIATNQQGFIICVGHLEDINTTGSLQGETWSDGDVLYLSPTVAGAITNVKPTGAGHIVVIGYVEYSHAIHGKIYVKVMNGWELDELHDVSITGAANGNYLEYNGTLWVNKGIVYTLELVAALTVDFYAPYNMKINTISNILNSPTITIQDDGVAYTLTNTIAAGSKITVTANTASVVNLNITKA